MSDAHPGPDSSSSSNEPIYPPKDRKRYDVHGNNHGVQTDQVNGGVHIYGKAEPQAEVVIRIASTGEITDAKEQFVAPGEYVTALAALRADHVVVLCGKGTGRTHAARRLLIHEFGLSTFSYLNRARPVDRLRAAELDEGAGYVLDLSGANDRPISDQAFTDVQHVVREARCRLVIVLDHRAKAPATASNQCVVLTAPAPVEVAQAALRRRHDVSEALLHVVKDDLAPALELASPDKAMFAARLAVEVHENGLELAVALMKLREETADAVARWFEKFGTRRHSYSFAVALLENQPYEHVFRRAWDLDERIREAGLAVDKNLRPRGVLDLPKTALLHRIAAVTEIRKHPRITGQTEETIKFERQDWAPAVFTHMWQQYPAARDILRDWMCDDTSEEAQDAVVRAIYAIVTTVPAREPIALVEHLASDQSLTRRSVAVATLVRLTENDRMRGPVDQIMRAWVDGGRAYRLWTVAQVYSKPSPHRPLHDVLEMFTEIGKSPRFWPQSAVATGMLSLLMDPSTREIALDTAVSWTARKHRETGLHRVALGLGLWATGFYDQSHELSLELSYEYPEQVTTLLHHVLDDDDYGPHLIGHLAGLAKFARWDADDAAELRRFARLILPQLDTWWRWRPAVRKLCRRHPAMRRAIHLIFRTARRVQPS